MYLKRKLEKDKAVKRCDKNEKQMTIAFVADAKQKKR